MAQFLYIITDSPYSSSAGIEALEAAIMGANFELDVALLFMHDGVMQLRAGQHSQGLKNVSKMFSALSDFGIERVYVDQLSLTARMLEQSDLSRAAELLDTKGVQDLIASSQKVFTF